MNKLMLASLLALSSGVVLAGQNRLTEGGAALLKLARSHASPLSQMILPTDQAIGNLGTRESRLSVTGELIGAFSTQLDEITQREPALLAFLETVEDPVDLLNKLAVKLNQPKKERSAYVGAVAKQNRLTGDAKWLLNLAFNSAHPSIRVLLPKDAAGVEGLAPEFKREVTTHLANILNIPLRGVVQENPELEPFFTAQEDPVLMLNRLAAEVKKGVPAESQNRKSNCVIS